MKKFFLIEIELNFNFREYLDSASYMMNQMLADGQIQTYGIAEDLSRMWITMLADSDLQVWELIAHLPVESVMEPIVTGLNTYNQSIDLLFPAVSLN